MSSSFTSKQLVKVCTASANSITQLENALADLNSADNTQSINDYLASKLMEIKLEFNSFHEREDNLQNVNISLRQSIVKLHQTISVHVTKIEEHQKRMFGGLFNERKVDENELEDVSHGYRDLKFRGKCQCEMCKMGIANTHNDSSHDQSLYSHFTLDVQSQSLPTKNRFSISLVGGSTKCGRVLSNYFASEVLGIENLSSNNMFEGKTCLEVGSGTGIVGFTVAYLKCDKIWMTDQPGMIEILEENKKQLSMNVQNRIETGELLWAEEQHLQRYESLDIDILIGSDLIYAHEFIEPLVITFERLSDRKLKKSGTFPVVFMAIIRRFQWEEKFFNLMERKFVQKKILEVGDICLYKYERKEDILSAGWEIPTASLAPDGGITISI